MRFDRDVDPVAYAKAVRPILTHPENPMRKVQVVVMLAGILSSESVSAQSAVRWHQISFGDPVIALDTLSVSKSPDGFPRATLMLTYAKARGGGVKLVGRAMEIVDFDCQSRQLRKKESITFDPEGEVVDSLPRGAYQSWVKVAPSSEQSASLAWGKPPVALGAQDFEELTAFCRTAFAHR
jgi:hypothetical protein